MPATGSVSIANRVLEMPVCDLSFSALILGVCRFVRSLSRISTGLFELRGLAQWEFGGRDSFRILESVVGLEMTYMDWHLDPGRSRWRREAEVGTRSQSVSWASAIGRQSAALSAALPAGLVGRMMTRDSRCGPAALGTTFRRFALSPQALGYAQRSILDCREQKPIHLSLSE